MMHLLAFALAAAQTASAGQTGVTSAAGETVKGQPVTFDLSGFRLGMSESDVERVMRERGMKVVRRLRTKTFEDVVRGLVNVRGGHLTMEGGSVLDSAELDDGKGGRVMLRLLAWPDGARVREVTYLPPAGTDAAPWRSLLVGRFGEPSRDSGAIGSEGLHAVWCGQANCSGEGGRFRLVADVNVRGGSIALAQPEGTAQRLSALVEQEAAKAPSGHAPAP